MCTASLAAAQTPVGALAIDERQGDQYGWAVDYETTGAAQARALSECGAGCRVVLTFNRCAAYAADQDAGSTAVGWAESFASAAAARQTALSACMSRGGTGCLVRAWGCNGPVVEDGLGLDRAARQQIQRGLQAAGFDPGGADGLFGPRTRAAIRRWQTSRGSRATGYLDGTSAAALRSSAVGQRPFREREPANAGAAAAASAELEGLFWESIADSTNPAEFEAYLRRFPAGMFSELAQIRLEALRAAANAAPASVGRPSGGVGSPASGPRPAGAADGPSSGLEAGSNARGRPGAAFRPDQTCDGQPADTACWMALADWPACYVWNPSLQPGATVTWTAACADGVAQGTGTLTWTVADGTQTSTGRLDEGKPTGHWIARFATGLVMEGPYIDGQQTGQWIFRYPDGRVGEGSLVGGELHGEWIMRRPDGSVGIQRWDNGELVGTESGVDR